MNNYLILISSNHEQAKNIESICTILKKEFIVKSFSDKIESPAVGNGKGLYINMICSINSTLNTNELNIKLKNIETAMGRTPELKKTGVVPIDLDIVECNGIIIREKDAGQSYYKECLKTTIR